MKKCSRKKIAVQTNKIISIEITLDQIQIEVIIQTLMGTTLIQALGIVTTSNDRSRNSSDNPNRNYSISLK